MDAPSRTDDGSPAGHPPTGDRARDRAAGAPGDTSTGPDGTVPQEKRGPSRRAVLLRLAALVGAVGIGSQLGDGSTTGRGGDAADRGLVPGLTGDGTRTAHRLPFASTSPWALPIVTAPVLVPEDDPMTENLRSADPWVNQRRYSHQVYYAKASDPVREIRDHNDSTRDTSAQIPDDVEAAEGSDAHAHVVQPDGRHIVEMFAFERDGDAVDVGRVHYVDLTGSGVGPANGVRAYGGSAIGGLIRSWEVDPDDPDYTGRIDHPIAWALSWKQLKHTRDPESDTVWGYYTRGRTNRSGQPGWPEGMPRGVTSRSGKPSAGFMKRRHPWPASEEDYSAPGNYEGLIPMGAYLCIPGDVDPDELDLEPETRMLFDAMQNYGGYVTDTVGANNTMAVYVEASAPESFSHALLNSPTWDASQLRKIVEVMRVVEVNDHENPNGGPLDAERRKPLHPRPTPRPQSA